MIALCICGDADGSSAQLYPHDLYRNTLPKDAYSPDWDKVVKDPSNMAVVQKEERFKRGMQLCAQQIADSGKSYDAVVCVDSTEGVMPRSINTFLPALETHIVFVTAGYMPWWAIYDYRTIIASQRNFQALAAISTLHRRQYALRNKTLGLPHAIRDHLYLCGLRAISVQA